MARSPPAARFRLRLRSVHPEYAALLEEVRAFFEPHEDKPEETPEAVARSLWMCAAGRPASIAAANGHALPELAPGERACLRRLVEEKRAGKPLAHLTGRQHFMGLELLAGPQALIPRRETEILGRAALAFLRALPDASLLAVDVCTGSGNLALALARHEAPPVRRWAVRAVGRLRDHRGVPIVHGALDDPDPEVRAEAAFAAGLIRDTTATGLVAKLAALALDPAEAEPVRVEAVGALARTPGAEARAAISRILESPDVPPAVLREALITAWRVRQPGPILDRVAQHLDAEDPERRWRAAYALMRSGVASAVPVVRRVLADPDHRVREHAVRALSAARADSVGEREAAVNDLIRAIADPHPHVRINAIRALAGYGDERAGDVLIAAASDPDPNVAVAALGALGSVPGTAAREALARFATDGAFARVATAAGIRPRDGRADKAVAGDVSLPIDAPPRDNAFYATVVRSLVLPDLIEGRRPRVRVHTTAGSFVIELAAAEAPLTVHNFLELARRGYFDGVRWHRVVPNFVIQGGDPTGTGSGGPGYAIRDEVNRIRFTRGVVGMALSGPDTGGSQFFVTHSPQPHLDGDFTIFGRVIEGMDVVDRTVQDDWIEKIEIL